MVRDGDLYARCQSGELGVPPKVMLEVEPERRERHIADIKALCGDQIYVAWANPGMVEFMRRGVNKGVALRTLTERIGGSTERVLAVGDADNDLPMLRSGGNRGVAGECKGRGKGGRGRGWGADWTEFCRGWICQDGAGIRAGWTGAKMMQVFCGIALCVAVVASALAQEGQAVADSLEGRGDGKD